MKSCIQYCIMILIIHQFNTESFGQIKVHSFGVDIGNSINAINVGYQNFEALGMGTNFITKGQPELSYVQPYFGCSVLLEYQPFHLMGRCAYDDRSGIIQDEYVQNSLIMKPRMSYLTVESAIMIEPWKNIFAYGGPSLSFLIQNQIGSIGDIPSTSSISAMNSPIPGFFAGVSTLIPSNINVDNRTVSIRPFAETSLLVNQRTGEFLGNQDGFDNIWSTASFRIGLSIALVNKKTELKEENNGNFNLYTPEYFSGKRSMKETMPILNAMSVHEIKEIFDAYKQYPISMNLSSSLLCTEIDPIRHSNDNTEQRLCIQKRALNYIAQYLKNSEDMLVFAICSKEVRSIEKMLTDFFIGAMNLPRTKILFETCKYTPDYDEQIYLSLASGDILYGNLELESVSPSENIIECTLDSLASTSSWNIQIDGPEQFSMNLGTINQRSVFLDGSTLLQSGAGTGSYSWTISHTDDKQNAMSLKKQFFVRMTSESKMQGHSFVYPQFWQDSIIEHQIMQDLSNYWKPNDEIVFVYQDSKKVSTIERVKKITQYIQDFVLKQDNPTLKNIKIIRKGGDLRLYDKKWSWGDYYEDGFRMEIVH